MSKRRVKETKPKRRIRKGAAAKRVTPKRAPAKQAGTARVKAKARIMPPARRSTSRSKKRAAATRPSPEGAEDRGQTVGLLREVMEHHETGPAASAGDVDADWQRAESSGEEAAGGSVSTPDQDRVDEIGHALGVEQPSQAPLRTSGEILGDRDQRYWDLERRASRNADKRREP